MRERGGVWIAHGAGNADRDVVDEGNSVEVPPDAPAYRLRRLWLTPYQEEHYYAGFANSALWPLCHQAHVRPQFKEEDWEAYQDVNRLFATRRRDRGAAGRVGLPERLSPGARRRSTSASGGRTCGRRCSGTFRGRTSIGCASVRGAGDPRGPARQRPDRVSAAARSAQLPQRRRARSSARRSRARPCTSATVRFAWSRFRSAPTSIASARSCRTPSLPDRMRRHSAGARARRTRSSASVSIGSTTPRAFPSGSRAIAAFLEERPDLVGRFVFVQIGVPSRSEVPGYAEISAEIDGLVDAGQHDGSAGSRRRRADSLPQEVVRAAGSRRAVPARATSASCRRCTTA